MLGARSSVETAVGSRPKLKTVRTRAVKTSAETIAVRDRNSRVRSLRAIVQACRNSSPIACASDRATVRLGDLGGAAPAPGRELHEPPPQLERDVGRQLHALVDVMRRQYQRAACAAERAQQHA